MSVNSYLTNLASSSIIRDAEKISINKSIENLQSKLKIVDSSKSDHFIFGSHNRGTILPRTIDENSDIDYMIVFDDNSKKPQSYLKSKCLAEEGATGGPYEGRAIDIKICLKTGS